MFFLLLYKDGYNSTTLSNKLTKQSTTKIANQMNTMGVEQAAYNDITGADGITLSYYTTAINGVSYIIVSGLVASANAGNFNKIALVDSNNNPIANQQFIGNNSNFVQGDTFFIMIPVPHGIGLTQTIKAQTQYVASDGKVKIISTATTSNTLTTTENVGIIEPLPSSIYLTELNPEQIITFANTGDTLAALENLSSNNPNIEIIFNPTTLNSGAVVTATARLKNKTLPATSGNISIRYNNGKEQIGTSISIGQNISPTPSPTPSPTAGLTVTISPDNNFFTTTSIATVSRQVTITNSGNTTENGISFRLPDKFSISNGSSNSCEINQATNSISNNLTSSGDSCNLTLTYSNSTVTSQSNADLSISYKYNNRVPAPIDVTTTLSYRVNQATAILNVSPDSVQTYNPITSNNSDISNTIIFTVTNSGDETATNLTPVFGGNNVSMFHNLAIDSTCGNSLASNNSNNTCTIATNFGPAQIGDNGDKNAIFNIS